MIKWEHAEQERQARMKEMEKDSAERLREAEERRAAETEVREASKKKQLILQTLQKLDDLTDPEAYFVAFETSMAEGDFAENDGYRFCGSKSQERHYRCTRNWTQRSLTKHLNQRCWRD